jgi:hypothetical protein
MAFILEDGTGVIGANAYLSATAMRAYWTDVGTTFTQTDAQLEVAIIKATRYVETRNQGRWKGEREFPDTPQGLSWPRLYVLKLDAAHCEDYYTGVPAPLQSAVAEYAQRALSTTLLPDPTQDPFVTREKTKAGPIEEEVQRLPGFQLFPPIPAADILLRPLIFWGSYTIR